VRTIHSAEIEELLRLTNETMRSAIDEDSFTYMLQAVLAFEDVPVWDEMLEKLVDGEYELENCPGCRSISSSRSVRTATSPPRATTRSRTTLPRASWLPQFSPTSTRWLAECTTRPKVSTRRTSRRDCSTSSETRPAPTTGRRSKWPTK